MALARSSATYTTNLGVVLANQPVRVLNRDKGYSVETVYSDPYGATPIASPATNGSGVFTFYARPGNYVVGVGVYRSNVTLSDLGYTLKRVKTSLTNRASTVTVTADPELVIPVAANTRYELEALLFTAGPDTADFRMTFTGPAGATIQWTPRGPSSLITGDPATLTLAQQGAGTEAVVGLYSVGAGIAAPKGLVQTGATAGNLSLAWAQGVSNAVPVGLAAGSWLSLAVVREF